MPLSEASLSYMSDTPLEYRKKMGQYMTPTEISDIIFDNITLSKNMKILDPAVGTGELLKAAKMRSNDLELHGWDVDQNIIKIASESLPEAKYRLQSVHDNIPQKYKEYFDIVIGNPPYFELKKSEYNASDFITASGGRTNIYGLFFEKYLPLLKPNGIMAYIVPPSMNAGAYFKHLRKFILENTTIKNIKIIRNNTHFKNALTSVQVIILQKTLDPNPSENSFIIDFNKYNKYKNQPIIFTDNKKLIEKTWKNKKSIYDYGYEVSTGQIAWNEYKNVLSNNTKDIILYYSKDITSQNIIELNEKLNDKRYIKTHKEPLTGESILVNRIVGSLDNPKLKIAKINSIKYFAENHVNVITPRKNITPLISLDELYQRLTKYDNLSQYLQSITGNTQISAKELMFLIPV